MADLYVDPAWSPFPTYKGQECKEILKREAEFMTGDSYVSPENEEARQKAVFVIEHVSKMMDEFDALVPYMALNFFDRFMAKEKEKLLLYDVRVYAISCLFLSWKIRSRDFDVQDFLKEKEIQFDIMKLVKVELHIARVLEWKFYPITAFEFRRHVCIIEKSNGYKLLVNKCIVYAQADIKMLGFKPSVVAASAGLLASDILSQAEQIVNDKVLELEYINKNELAECKKVMKEICKNKFSEEDNSSDNDYLMSFNLKWSQSCRAHEDHEIFTKLFKQPLTNELKRKKSSSNEEEETGITILRLVGKLHYLVEGSGWNKMCDGNLELIKQKKTGKVYMLMCDCVEVSVLGMRSFQHHPRSCSWTGTQFVGELEEKKFCCEFETVGDCKKFVEVLQKNQNRDKNEPTNTSPVLNEAET